MIKILKTLFTPISENEKIEQYLAESVSLVDLEIRERKITRGEAPFQKSNNVFNRGFYHAN